MRTKFLLIIFSMLSLFACQESQESEYDEDVYEVISKKYLYLDDNGTFHARSSCHRLLHGKDDSGHEIYSKHLVDTTDFVITNPDYFRVCTNCVSDIVYEKWLMISERNKIEQVEDSVAILPEEWYHENMYPDEQRMED